MQQIKWNNVSAGSAHHVLQQVKWNNAFLIIGTLSCNKSNGIKTFVGSARDVLQQVKWNNDFLRVGTLCFVTNQTDVDVVVGRAGGHGRGCCGLGHRR